MKTLFMKPMGSSHYPVFEWNSMIPPKFCILDFRRRAFEMQLISEVLTNLDTICAIR